MAVEPVTGPGGQSGRTTAARVFELRKYELFPGTIERMRARFAAINRPLFDKHGIRIEHVWEEIDNPNVFYFVASFAERAARKAAWDTYHQDPVFLEAKAGQATIIKSIELHLFEASDERQP